MNVLDQNVGLAGVVIGELVAVKEDAVTPLVMYAGQPGSAAVAARSVVDVHGGHIGKDVVLVFENGDRSKPIILGVLKGDRDFPLEAQPDQVRVDADGERLVVTAKEQLVLQCGKASITCTKTGKIVIRGTYVSSHSSGVNRIVGGSVQIN